jgi:predicted TIM-barrel fold metal-dependent hydrolase
MGWHIQFMVSPPHLVDLAPRLEKLRCDFVVDHMGDIQAAQGTAQPAFQALLALLRDGRGWTKLSAGYHLTREAPPYPEVLPLVAVLAETRPDRLLWGSDWPHANHDGPMPNSTDLFDLLLDWLPNDELRRRVLVDNPRTLYGF